MPAPAAVSVAKKRRFLEAYAACGNITAAARQAEVHRGTHYEWLAADPAYREAFAEAEEQAIDVLEAEARRRAVEGVEKPVFHNGEIVGTVREYSNTLLIFLLKGARPERYRERISVVTEDAIDHEIARLEAQLGSGAAPSEAPPPT